MKMPINNGFSSLGGPLSRIANLLFVYKFRFFAEPICGIETDDTHGAT